MVDHIFTLHAAIERHFANNSKLCIAFIDFKKAYDSINRIILWSRTIKAMYASIQVCVKSNSATELFSGFPHCFQGLKQKQIIQLVHFVTHKNKQKLEIHAVFEKVQSMIS